MYVLMQFLHFSHFYANIDGKTSADLDRRYVYGTAAQYLAQPLGQMCSIQTSVCRLENSKTPTENATVCSEQAVTRPN